MLHRTLKTTAVATAGGVALALGVVACQPVDGRWPMSCVAPGHVRHTAITHSQMQLVSVGKNIMHLTVRTDSSVTKTVTVVGPADGPHTKLFPGGRNVNIAFRTNVMAFDVWVYMSGRGGACTASLGTSADHDHI